MADGQKRADGFVSLTSIRKGAPDPSTALREIRQIYFKTSRRTIEHDFAHAVDLLKALPDEETRARAHVYMEGLADMQREWGAGGTIGQRGKSEPRATSGRRGGRGKAGTSKRR